MDQNMIVTLREDINDLDTILSTQSLVDRLKRSQLKDRNLRLDVWLQDINYMLSRLREIRETAARDLHSICEHKWETDHVELNADGEMKTVTYCMNCLYQKE
jgi:hypothetical protein